MLIIKLLTLSALTGFLAFGQGASELKFVKKLPDSIIVGLAQFYVSDSNMLFFNNADLNLIKRGAIERLEVVRCVSSIQVTDDKEYIYFLSPTTKSVALIQLDLNSLVNEEVKIKRKFWDFDKLIRTDNAFVVLTLDKKRFYNTKSRDAFKSKTFDRYSKPILEISILNENKNIRKTFPLNFGSPDSPYKTGSFYPYKEDLFITADTANTIFVSLEGTSEIVMLDKNLNVLGYLSGKSNSNLVNNFELKNIFSPREWLSNEERYDLESNSYLNLFYNQKNNHLYRIYQKALHDTIVSDSSYLAMINDPDFFTKELCLAYPESMLREYDLIEQRALYIQEFDLLNRTLIRDELLLPQSAQNRQFIKFKDGWIYFLEFNRMYDKQRTVINARVVRIHV